MKKYEKNPLMNFNEQSLKFILFPGSANYSATENAIVEKVFRRVFTAGGRDLSCGVIN
jgi:hypothetical protein